MIDLSSQEAYTTLAYKNEAKIIDIMINVINLLNKAFACQSQFSSPEDNWVNQVMNKSEKIE